jgi:hypothetical protein
MARTSLTPGRLYALLVKEFEVRRSRACGACRMPLPFLIERPDDVSANWRIGTPPECGHGCHSTITEIAAAAWPQYDLNDPVSVPRPDEDPAKVAKASEVPREEG